MGCMFFHALFLFGRFQLQDIGAEDDIGLRGVAVFVFGIGEGQDVGGVILATVIAVQVLAFGGVNEAQGDLRRGQQGGLDPAT
ncbi:hypothetical protein D3C81_2052520 [compost metagenome]